jgi:hypothetical protein
MSNETKYGRYIIRSRQQTSDWTARAFRGGRIAWDGLGEVHRGATQQDAINAVIEVLKAFDSRERALRAEAYPTAKEVQVAIKAMDRTITPKQWAMLMAHLRAPNHIMTATELADAAGYDSYTAVNIQYGTLGKNLADELDWKPQIEKGNQEPTWTFALAVGADEDGSAKPDAHWRWELRREVVEALLQAKVGGLKQRLSEPVLEPQFEQRGEIGSDCGKALE